MVVKDDGPAQDRATTPDTPTGSDMSDRTAQASQQCSWWTVHIYVEPILTQAHSWPVVGSPAWCELADGDPRKLAALFDAAQHHALRVEIAQEARCAASREISAAADWAAIAQEVRNRGEFYAARPWLKRVAS